MQIKSLRDISRIKIPETSVHIESRYRNSNAIIIAPHGGNIEFGTTEIARFIAGDKHSFYSLVCVGTEEKCALYHLPSHLFDEPECLNLVGNTRLVISIHGMRETSDIIVVGGLLENSLLIEEFLKAGFHAVPGTQYPRISGTDPNNICNRGVLRQGIQIEISQSLRFKLIRNRTLLKRFSNAVGVFIESKTLKAVLDK